MQISPLQINYQNTPIKQAYTRQVKTTIDSSSKKDFNTCDLNFCANYLYDVNLRRRTTKRPIGAKVVELDFSDKDDLLMLNLASFWRATSYFSPISSDYCKNSNKFKFFAIVDGNNSEPNAKDVKSLVQFRVCEDKNEGKTCDIIYLQCASDIADNEKSSIRGAGELAVYSVVNYAKKCGCEKVTLQSTNNGFYENIGFEMGAGYSPISGYCPFYLDKKDYDWFLKRVEEKYKFN